MSQQHIFREFDNGILALKAEVMTMANLTLQIFERAIHSLCEHDIALARAVIADDSDIDDLERRIDQSGMQILARFHPVASDLRLVVTSMKIAHNLERISDHAVGIAKRAKKLCKATPLEEVALAKPLYAVANQLLRDALTAYENSDAKLGESLKPRDKELDRLHKQMIASLSGLLENSNGRAECLLHLIIVARSLERIGDLAVNIGEDAVFLGEARNIRHEAKSPPPEN